MKNVSLVFIYNIVQSKENNIIKISCMLNNTNQNICYIN